MDKKANINKIMISKPLKPKEIIFGKKKKKGKDFENTRSGCSSNVQQSSEST